MYQGPRLGATVAFKCYMNDFKEHLATGSFTGNVKIWKIPELEEVHKIAAHELNIGAVGKDKKVDQWHFDSANFVAVLIFSNIDNMIGRDFI